MGTSNDFGESAPQDDLGARPPIDDLLDPTMSDDDLLLAARLDRSQDQDQRVPPPPGTTKQRQGWPPPPPPPTVTRPNRLERDPHGMLGGVLSGVAYRLGIDAGLARVLFMLALAFSGGTLIPVYLILWGVIPEAPPNSDLALQRSFRRRNRRFSRIFGVTLAFVGAVWLLNVLASWAALLVPIGFVALGVWLFWRDRNATEDEEIPMPFTESMDPLATSAEYQHYIVNKAKRLEQQKRRRNTTIGVTALLSTVLLIGAIGGLASPDTETSVASVSDEPRFVDIPDQDAEMNPENAGLYESTQSVKDSDQAVSVTRTSSLASDYTVTDGSLRIDLSDAVFDTARTVTIDARDSQVEIRVPPGAELEYETNLSGKSNFTDDRFQKEAEFEGPSSPLKVVITGGDTDVTLKDY